MQKKTAVVLFQLGGPDSPEAIEPFLYNLFCDPDIINFPGAFLARKPLARFIALRRAKKVAGHYAEIGGRSPIIDLTMAQADALDRELNKLLPARVFVAMRYWHPLTREVIDELKKERYERIILLPLYPQFSKATTVSSMKEWDRQCRIHNFHDVPTASICCYHNHPMYVEAIVDKINTSYAKFADVNPLDVDLVFSAHGVPVSLIKEGDPYQRQIEETIRLVCERGGWISPHHVCFQSKVGPSEWLKPSLDTTMRALTEKGRKYLLVVPIAFVTEHIETLHEIDMEAREHALRLGIQRFEMMPALNDAPKFIACLVDLVMKKIASTTIGLDTCRRLFQRDPGRTSPVICPFWAENAGGH